MIAKSFGSISCCSLPTFDVWMEPLVVDLRDLEVAERGPATMTVTSFSYTLHQKLSKSPYISLQMSLFHKWFTELLKLKDDFLTV